MRWFVDFSIGRSFGWSGFFSPSSAFSSPLLFLRVRLGDEDLDPPCLDVARRVAWEMGLVAVSWRLTKGFCGCEERRELHLWVWIVSRAKCAARGYTVRQYPPFLIFVNSHLFGGGSLVLL